MGPNSKSAPGSFPMINIESVPNMRLLCTRRTDKVWSSKPIDFSSNGTLYRSSKPDRITHNDLAEFRKLGIKCIIDFRSSSEYFKSHDAQRLLDKEYTPYKVVVAEPIGHSPTIKHIDPRKITQTDQSANPPQNGKCSESCETSVKDTSADVLEERTSNDQDKKHFLIDFFSAKYLLKIFAGMPSYICCIGILYLLYDLVRLDTSFPTFGLFFTSKVLNRTGIQKQYYSMVDFSQPSICAALKLLANPENQPALINCAHGKDRTGVVSALVLSCLGVPDEIIVEDYAQTQEGLKPIIHLVRKDLVDKYQLNEEFLGAEAPTMMNLLTYIKDKYGSVENYLETIGFSCEEQIKLRANMSPAATWVDTKNIDASGAQTINKI